MSAAEQELLREGRRVLRKLANGKKLVAFDKERFIVTGSGKRNAMKVDRAMVRAFAARDWIRGSDETSYAISEAGRGWLKRAQSVTGNAFADQHRVLTKRRIIDRNGIEYEVAYNELESPIAWLRHRGLIDTVQYEAANRLRRDYTLARLAPRLAVDLETPVVDMGGKSPSEFSDMVLAAKQRFVQAMKAVGPGLADLLFDVCCHLMRLEGIEEEMGWPKRSAKVVLQIALDRLGAHYGLRVRRPLRSRLRNWAAAV